VAFGVVVAADRMLAAWAPGHFIPAQKLASAIAAGDECVVLLGDSRMAAGFDRQAMNRELGGPCVADLSMGGVKLEGQVLALRKYLRSGRRPRAVVLGISPDTLVEPIRRIEMQSIVGSQAALLLWSDASDVFDLFPGFPKADLIEGAEFLLKRSNALTVYSSIVWKKVSAFQDRLTGEPLRPENPFGQDADMRALADEFLQKVSHLGSGQAPRWHRWYRKLLELSRGTRLFLVEVPMNPAFRELAESSRAVANVREWLSREPVALLPAGSFPPLDERYFPDQLHLSAEGAALFSAELGRKLREAKI
jgi:hypothetical protein